MIGLSGNYLLNQKCAPMLSWSGEMLLDTHEGSWVASSNIEVEQSWLCVKLKRRLSWEGVRFIEMHFTGAFMLSRQITVMQDLPAKREDLGISCGWPPSAIMV
ncbi:uncharacterized protein LOC130789633 [Actinidia eriantha]|uniref:uncharacterized protein LOC130789633 n=1 Tax=Actinidia eriantha TaxID=165200 RepID=UPI00258F673B|nr:uncharacterized protein LOC130789633 [Actinidia eriantha]